MVIEFPSVHGWQLAHEGRDDCSLPPSGHGRCNQPSQTGLVTQTGLVICSRHSLGGVHQGLISANEIIKLKQTRVADS